MQIPIPNFGNALPQEAPTVSVPRLGTGAGMEALGQAGMHIAGQELALDRENIIAAQRARTALALAKVNNDAHALHDNVTRGVMDGSIAPEEATQQLSDGIQKISATHLDGMPPQQRQLVEDNVLNTTGALTRSLQGTIVKRQQNDTLSTIDQFGEQVQREAVRNGPGWASDKYGAMLDFTGRAAGLTETQVASKKQAFRENATYNFYDAAGTDSLTRGDVAGVTGVLQKIQGPDGETLDPLKRIKLEHQLFGYQQHLLAQQARAQNAADDEQRIRENAAADIYNKGADLMTSGQYFSPDFIKAMTDSATGTSLQEPVKALLAMQTQVAGFASRPIPEQKAIIENARSRGATPGIGSDPASAKALSAMEQMNDKAQAAAKENPWSAAQKYGVIEHAEVMQVTNAADAIPILQQRMQTILQVENWVGHKISPLQPEEADKIAKGIAALPPDQAATLLGQFGAVLKDSDRVNAVAKQIHDKDGTLGLAMSYTNAQTNQGRYTAELLLKGAQAEKDGTVKPDGAKETGWKSDIATQVRGAYSNQEVENQVVRAAYLIAGANGGDVDNAVRLATGGIIDFNGSKIPMPYGMTTDGQSAGEKRFRRAIETVDPATITAQTTDGTVKVGSTFMDAKDFTKSLPDARLVHGGQGVYYVRAGNTLVTNAQGRPIAVQVKP